ncbi:MAG: TspO/MBR family protein [Reyranellaceae bacterium]
MASRSISADLPMLGVFVAAVAVVAVAGALFSPAVDPVWYAGLSKPSFNPPNWVFAPVWTTLYVLIALSAWLVWRRAGWTGGGRALSWWFAQLALNAAWTPVFFGVHRIGLALAIIVALLVAIIGTIAAFRRHHALAAAMLLPYLAWVGFATILNASIWRLNA